ncbi:MAG: hypothetical protein GC200_06580 [Tepidisphaera sp.]|nr:hypothetical protein [Tepidisphaera sp.]
MLADLLNPPAAWFTAAGLIGTGIFSIRLAMALLGGHGGHDGGVDLSGHAGFGGHDAGHGDAGHHSGAHDAKGQSTQTFSLLSLQSIVGFLMGFGWGGIAGLKGFGWSWWMSVLAGVACGLFMIYLLGITFRAIYSLAASGTIEIWQAVGTEGEVYANVPLAGDGLGKVKLVISSRQRLLNAVAAEEPLATRTRVRVVRVNSDNTVTVARV